jgi:hypothetical protein
MLRDVISCVKSERDRLEFEKKDDILSAVRESSKIMVSMTFAQAVGIRYPGCESRWESCNATANRLFVPFGTTFGEESWGSTMCRESEGWILKFFVVPLPADKVWCADLTDPPFMPEIFYACVSNHEASF